MARRVKLQCDLAFGLAGAVRHVMLSDSEAELHFEGVFADMWLYPESSVE